jgi:DNA invertase Pin-like site-specific DNA recombinase
MKATTTNTTTEQANTCVIYTRVSTEEQTHGTSLESQLADCLRIAAARGLTVLESIEDAGLSGTIDERPGLMRAQSLIASGKASGLVVYRLDRLARRLRGVIAIAEGLDKHRGWILTADGNEYGNTFTGRFFLQMLGAMAEMEHRQIVERCQRGREARARQGVQPSRAWSPYGYHIPTSQEVMRGEYLLEELGLYIPVPLLNKPETNPADIAHEVYETLRYRGFAGVGVPINLTRVNYRPLSRDGVIPALRRNGVNSKGVGVVRDIDFPPIPIVCFVFWHLAFFLRLAEGVRRFGRQCNPFTFSVLPDYRFEYRRFGNTPGLGTRKKKSRRCICQAKSFALDLCSSLSHLPRIVREWPLYCNPHFQKLLDSIVSCGTMNAIQILYICSETRKFKKGCSFMKEPVSLPAHAPLTSEQWEQVLLSLPADVVAVVAEVAK